MPLCQGSSCQRMRCQVCPGLHCVRVSDDALLSLKWALPGAGATAKAARARGCANKCATAAHGACHLVDAPVNFCLILNQLAVMRRYGHAAGHWGPLGPPAKAARARGCATRCSLPFCHAWHLCCSAEACAEAAHARRCATKTVPPCRPCKPLAMPGRFASSMGSGSTIQHAFSQCSLQPGDALWTSSKALSLCVWTQTWLQIVCVPSGRCRACSKLASSLLADDCWLAAPTFQDALDIPSNATLQGHFQQVLGQLSTLMQPHLPVRPLLAQGFLSQQRGAAVQGELADHCWLAAPTIQDALAGIPTNYTLEGKTPKLWKHPEKDGSPLDLPYAQLMRMPIPGVRLLIVRSMCYSPTLQCC